MTYITVYRITLIIPKFQTHLGCLTYVTSTCFDMSFPGQHVVTASDVTGGDPLNTTNTKDNQFAWELLSGHVTASQCKIPLCRENS